MKKIALSILLVSSILYVNAQAFQSIGDQNVVGKLSVNPTGTTSDNAYNGNIIITKPQVSGQYLNFVRAGYLCWSLGTAYNTSTFAIGQGTTSDAGFTAPVFNITPAGNVGIGTTTPSSMLQVAASSGNGLRIGKIGDAGTLTVPLDSVAASYNLDFTGYRDVVIDQIGARIAALRFNICQTNNALVQTTGLAFYTNPSGLYSGATSLVERMRIMPNGNIGIGCSKPQYKLDVSGTIHANEVIINLTEFPDFVFEKNYKLLKLQDVDNYIQTKGHLPNIPSAMEVEKSGMNMADLQVKLLQKVEELTLYAIDQQKLVSEQQRRIEQLENSLKDHK